MKGETLSQSQLAAARPIGSEGGRAVRAYCPFHGSDRQRSLRVNLESGRFECFACGVWGYLDSSREKYRAGQTPVMPRPVRRAEPVAVEGLEERLEGYQDALPGSAGSEYLRQRGIDPEWAQGQGIGYCAAGRWPNAGRDWRQGRVVFPHRNPAGELVNLYGRAVELGVTAGAGLRHDHLSGPKGYFGGELLGGKEAVYVCEGPFDALSLRASGCMRALAIFGVNGWRWEWVREVRRLVFALDADGAGQRAWQQLGREGCYRGKEVFFLPPEAYGGAKDVNEAYRAGTLVLAGSVE